ncbi:MAG: hypothetical protein ACYCZR_08075 [Burkholderiales bacterium]
MITEPTAGQCTAKALVFEEDGKVGYAIWYPQMGGYAGKAVAIFDAKWTEKANGCREGGCIDVLVWHDGEFPFSEGQGEPKQVHHCDPEQFITFGEELAELNDQRRVKI